MSHHLIELSEAELESVGAGWKCGCEIVCKPKKCREEHCKPVEECCEPVVAKCC